MNHAKTKLALAILLSIASTGFVVSANAAENSSKEPICLGYYVSRSTKRFFTWRFCIA